MFFVFLLKHKNVFYVFFYSKTYIFNNYAVKYL